MICSECEKELTNENDSYGHDCEAKTEIKAKVGDIFVWSWGYEQTNINFFQVVGVTPSGVKLREIQKETTETGFMCGTAMPIKDKFVEKALMQDFKDNKPFFKKTYLFYGVPHISMPYGSCGLWNGKPESVSWYG